MYWLDEPMTQGDHLKSDEQKAAATSLAEDRSDEPVWGEHRGWSRRQTITAIGVAAVIAGLGGAAIYAASSSGASAVPHRHGPVQAVARRTRRGACPRTPPLHGEFVVADDNGGYTTELTQTRGPHRDLRHVHHGQKRRRVHADLRPAGRRRRRTTWR